MATRRGARSNNMSANGRRYDTREVSPLEITNDDVAPPEPSDPSKQGEGKDNSASIEEQYHSEREQSKLRHWKESEYAAGLVEPTWNDELDMHRRRGGCCCCPNREAIGQMFQEEIDPGCGCVYLSAVVCSRLGAGRIGNMAVLKERYVTVEVDDDEDVEGQERPDGFVDEEDGSLQKRRGSPKSGESNNSNGTKKKKTVRRREIQFVLGPFWPMLLFITYPLIFGVSALTLYVGIPGRAWYVQGLWALLTIVLIRALFNTGFRDPGILNRRKTPPPNQEELENEENSRRGMPGFRWRNEEGPWRWSDQAQSYRPKNSMYCPDCKVIVEEFDHTCPWTGTAIGKKNMGAFQVFVGLVFVCLIMDIFLLTTAGM